MALVKYGNGVAAISGKIAGNVFARNKAGAYIRNWAKPTSTPTISQTQNRARFGNQSAAWGAITAAQRDAWNAAAPGTQLLNRLGDPYVPTGRQLFLASNNQLVATGEAQVLDVPANFTPPEISPDVTFHVVVVAGVYDKVDLQATGVDATKVYNVEATGPMADIKTNLTNVYRYIGSFAGAGTDVDMQTEYEALYGDAATVGQVIWFRVKTVDVANGKASSALIYKATIV